MFSFVILMMLLMGRHPYILYIYSSSYLINNITLRKCHPWAVGQAYIVLQQVASHRVPSGHCKEREKDHLTCCRSTREHHWPLWGITALSAQLRASGCVVRNLRAACSRGYWLQARVCSDASWAQGWSSCTSLPPWPYLSCAVTKTCPFLGSNLRLGSEPYTIREDPTGTSSGHCTLCRGVPSSMAHRIRVVRMPSSSDRQVSGKPAAIGEPQCPSFSPQLQYWFEQ